MGCCKDFVNETTLLQETLKELGVLVIRTPKCHSEVVGEGVEYSWGGSKNNYRRLPMKLKTGKDNFIKSVEHVLSRDQLNTKLVRKFARRARAYTCAYYVMDNNMSSDTAAIVGLTGNNTLPDIEKLTKTFKTHRCALDFDNNFCISN